MATNFPTSLDSNTDPAATDPLNSPSHSGEHTNHNDQIEALQDKVGIDGSADSSSLDYQMENHAHTGGSDDGGQVSHGNLGSVTANQHHAKSHAHDGADGSGTVAGADLTGTPGGELGNTWASPTVDATHSGSAHHDSLTIGADGEHSLSTQVLSGVDASTTQKGHAKVGADTPTTQAFSDSAVVGAGDGAANSLHKHAWPALGTSAAAIGTSAGGSATTPSKSDHVHATGAGTPSTQAFGDAASTGSGPAAAMTDHKHAMPSFATPAIVLGTAAAAGAATTPIRSDSTIAAFDATVPVTQAYSDVAAAGSAAVAARRDHKHGMPAAASGGVVDTQVFTGSGTWTRPTFSGASLIRVTLIGGGGQGGGGSRTAAAGSGRGGSGGSGGSVVQRDFLYSDIAENLTVTVGAIANAAGGGSTSNGVDGTAGTTGNDSKIVGATSSTEYAIAKGGTGGAGGVASAGSQLGTLGTAGSTWLGGAGGPGSGSDTTTTAPTAPSVPNFVNAAGAAPSSPTPDNWCTGAGGGGGGGGQAAGTRRAGGAGGGAFALAGGAAGGVGAGGSVGNNAKGSFGPGSGGGGGGGGTSGGGAGAAGGNYGGGGGGGGAGNASNGGNGGAGTAGVVVITTI